ncbi:MAG TPA: hypothetical protein VKZ66_05700 [Pusillimonas sp.]|uniref:hypothetical protein n=1 Tax=unclassified Pusillimonas TaxID=2640016 RepID=UPI00262A7DE0|nr:MULTISPECIES: hypothetical protein [unclassified Pusillimonas]HLU19434.1 hypothetical protein [Pusillimonas sp.]
MGNEYKAVHEIIDEPGSSTAVRGDTSMPQVLMLGFRYLAWLNGVGVLLIALSALGVIPTEVPSYLLRLPLIAFLCGLALTGLGLLWVYMVQASLLLRAPARRRHHWLPVICVLGCYCASMAVFIVGCWILVGMGGLATDGWTHDFGWLPLLFTG